MGFWEGIDSVYWFLAFKPNPLLQFVYLTLVCGIFYAFILNGFPLIDDYTQNQCWIFVLSTLGIFLWATMSSPTVINKKNAEQLVKRVKVDRILYQDTDKLCATCKTPRIARSKHCSVCDHCVHCFDHHCYWLNVCISSSNKLQFLMFLLSTFLLCCWCIYLCMHIVWTLGLQKKILTPDSSLLEFAKLFLVSGGPFLTMSFLTLSAAIAVLTFFVFHLYLALNNITTNEYVKRNRLAKTEGMHLKNIYHLGYWSNLSDLFFSLTLAIY